MGGNWVQIPVSDAHIGKPAPTSPVSDAHIGGSGFTSPVPRQKADTKGYVCDPSIDRGAQRQLGLELTGQSVQTNG